MEMATVNLKEWLTKLAEEAGVDVMTMTKVVVNKLGLTAPAYYKYLKIYRRIGNPK